MSRLKRKTRLRPIARKRKRREGRLDAAGVKEVREAVFARGQKCEMRKWLIDQIEEWVVAEKIGYMHGQDMKRRVLIGCTGVPTDWAHIKSRGAGGYDSPENTLASCRNCHSLSHNAIKPVPAKEKHFTDDDIRRTGLPKDVMSLIHDLCYHHDGRDVLDYVRRAQEILKKESQ